MAQSLPTAGHLRGPSFYGRRRCARRRVPSHVDLAAIYPNELLCLLSADVSTITLTAMPPLNAKRLHNFGWWRMMACSMTT